MFFILNGKGASNDDGQGRVPRIEETNKGGGECQDNSPILSMNAISYKCDTIVYVYIICVYVYRFTF